MNKTLLIAGLLATTFTMSAANQQSTMLPPGIEAHAAMFKAPVRTGFPRLVQENRMNPMETPAKAQNMLLPDGHIQFYAYQSTGTGLYQRGFLDCNSLFPSYPTLIKEWPNGDVAEEYITSGVMVGDTYYAYITKSYFLGYMQDPVGLGIINLETGEIEKILVDESEEQDTNHFLEHMSYDPKTGYIYALRRRPLTEDLYDEDGNWLFWGCMVNTGFQDVVRIDPANPTEIEWIGEVDFMTTMAVDNGMMYFVENNSMRDEEGYLVFDENGYEIRVDCNLKRVDLNIWEDRAIEADDVEDLGKINKGILKIEYEQTMEFDHTTHTLWWACMDVNANLTLRTLDLNSRITSTVGDIGSLKVYRAMGIPYQTAADGAPSKLVGFTAEVAENGEEKIYFSWSNPSVDYQLNALTELSGIRVYRDGEEYKVLDSRGIGQTQYWDDDEVVSGMHTYKFVPFNSEGDGIYSEITVFIGRDVPGRVWDIASSIDGNKATVTWTAPRTGANNGWFDKETLAYNVVRMPDQKVVAEGIKECRVEDEADVFRGYSYVITPVNKDGEGTSVTSNIVPFGNKVELPYSNSVDTELESNDLMVLDANEDYNTWEFKPSLVESGKNVMRYVYSDNDAEDFLVLPEMNFEDGNIYEIRFNAGVSNMYPGQKHGICVAQGNAKTAEAFANVIWDTAIAETADLLHWDEYSIHITDPSKGNILAIGAQGSGFQFIEVRDIEVRRSGDIDVEARSIDGLLTANAGLESTHSVVVKNCGLKDAEDVKVQIVDPTTESVLGETTLDKLAANEIASVPVKWTPAAEGMATLVGRVIVDGDINGYDNDTEPVFINVKKGDAEIWVNVGEPQMTGWVVLYSMNGAGANATIYLPEELPNEDLKIIGVQYVYNCSSAAPFQDMPITINLGTCDDRSYTEGYDNSWNFVQVADPEVEEWASTTFSASEGQDQNLTVMWDIPYPYEAGKSLVVELKYTGEKTSDNLNWYMYSTGDWDTGIMRTKKTAKNTSYDSNSPFIRLAYTTGTGVKGFFDLGDISIKVEGRDIVAPGAKKIVVSDMNGRIVRNASRCDRVSMLDAGIYLVQIQDMNGNNISRKVVIK